MLVQINAENDRIRILNPVCIYLHIYSQTVTTGVELPVSFHSCLSMSLWGENDGVLHDADNWSHTKFYQNCYFGNGSMCHTSHLRTNINHH
jgi:hypothetical protein